MPRQNGRNFADDIFKCILLDENIWISNKFSLKFVTKGPIYIIPEVFQIMAWRQSDEMRQATSQYLNQWWLVINQIQFC